LPGLREREVDELALQGGRVYLHLGRPPRRTTATVTDSGHGRGRPQTIGGLWRLRAAFGFVEVLRVLAYHDDQDQDDGEPLDEDDQAPPLPTGRALVRRQHAAAVHDPLALVRIGPQQLIGGRPAGMLGRGMPLEILGAEKPAAGKHPGGSLGDR
jgi:hypothetical protein